MEEYNDKPTRARIFIGRTGTAVLHTEALAFKLAHARARDAVYTLLDTELLREKISMHSLPVIRVNSKALERSVYLQRPDLGRALPQEFELPLQDAAGNGFDTSIILADGLSPEAIMKHAPPLLSLLVPALRSSGLTLAPLVICEQGRVAISDSIGQLIGARLVLILIGERPGLSSPHSMGAYLTWQPRPGLTDDSRNCISNIRPEGLSYEQACAKILYLVKESTRRKLSGVALKDEAGQLSR